MYRYTVDNSITYSSTDLVLFKTSPFACWMERLTLDNPAHGIPPDPGSSAPCNPMARQDELADTLRAEGKRVRLIAWDEAEPARRKTTLEAMRAGIDFIVDGQLALGPLASPANLLMRTSGYSELGDFLYMPCDTQVATPEDSIFRLCFLADLLHSLQGQLPPQMLFIRSAEDLVAVQTEEHIYHYRAVKQRFMAAMRDFRKHRMPDPAASAHFGRWSDCAREVLKQRLLREERQIQMAPAEAASHGDVCGAWEPSAGGDALSELNAIDLEIPLRLPVGAGEAAEMRPDDGVNAPCPAGQKGSGEDQAIPESGSGPVSEPRRRRADAPRDNLGFIGSSHPCQGSGRPPEVQLPPFTGTAPAPSLRAPRVVMSGRAAFDKVTAEPDEPAPRVPFSDSLITGPDRER